MELSFSDVSKKVRTASPSLIHGWETGFSEQPRRDSGVQSQEIQQMVFSVSRCLGRHAVVGTAASRAKEGH